MPLNKKKLESLRETSPLSAEIMQELRRKRKTFSMPKSSKKIVPQPVTSSEAKPISPVAKNLMEMIDGNAVVETRKRKKPATKKAESSEKQSLEQIEEKKVEASEKQPLEQNETKRAKMNTIESFNWMLIDACREQKMTFEQSSQVVSTTNRLLNESKSFSQNGMEERYFAVSFACKELGYDFNMAMELNNRIRSVNSKN